MGTQTLQHSDLEGFRSGLKRLETDPVPVVTHVVTEHDLLPLQVRVEC